MDAHVEVMSNKEMKACRFDQEEAGFGSLVTEKGHLPLKSMDVSTRITGLY